MLFTNTAVTAAEIEQWTRRGESTVSALHDVQHALTALVKQTEVTQDELGKVRTEAVLLAALRIDELRNRREQTGLAPHASARSAAATATAAAAPKSHSSKERPGSGVARGAGQAKRDSRHASSIMSEMSGGPPSLEGAVGTLDEKRRLRVMTALSNLFRQADETSPASATAAATMLTTVAASGANTAISPARTPTPPHRGNAAADGTRNDVSTTAAAAATGVASATRTESDPRRPRDVPPVLWDEMLQLCQARGRLEERLELLAMQLSLQLRRFELLQKNSTVAHYALRAAQGIERAAVGNAQ